jgi:serine/threonine protein kinase/tetratricopeptide (TPR) repeat protein
MAIFNEALERDSPADRAAYLDRACAGDPALRARVEELLAVHRRAGGFLESPVIVPTIDPVSRGPDECPGGLIGSYKLLERIGEGGMGEVWMAEQRQPMQRKVALKIIKAGMDTHQVVARFEAERQALALMDHPHIARVLDGGATACGRPYFVMELVKGTPITIYCDEHRLTVRERLELFLPVCQAIQHAHQKGIIHRDIKPSNVLIAPYDGRPVPKIIDFGVAKATGQRLTERTLYTGFGSIVGTLEYMSPEQAELNNQDIDTRSDIFALGVLLYELLAGTTPLSHERVTHAAFTEILRAIREEEPPKPSARLSDSQETLPAIAAQRHTEPARLTKLVHGELDWIVMKALEKDRNRRYDTANGLARDIEHYLADEPVQACPPSAWYRLGKFARRNNPALAVAGLVLFFLVVLGAVSGWVLRDRAARRAETTRQVRESLTRARQWSGENKLALARQELAAVRARMGSDRPALSGLAAEIEALDSELGGLEHFLDLVDQAHEAEFPQPVALALPADSAGPRAAADAMASTPAREPAKAVPFVLQALSCYGVLERDDWSARLEGGLLERDQVAQVRRTAYEQLLWLADDAARRQVDHRSGSKVSPRKAAQEGWAYLRPAEAAARPTSAFYQIRARCLKALGKPAEARQDENLARQTPGTIALDHYLLGLAAYDAKDKAEAVKQFEAALRVEPTHYWSLRGLGGCLYDLGRQEQDFALAAVAYTGCILKRPDHANAYVGRGAAHATLQRFTEAEADFRQALRLRPDFPSAHYNLGNALRDQGKLAEADAEYRQALLLQPNYPQALVNLGNILNAQGKPADAEAKYRQALRLQPDFPEAHIAHNNLGNALRRQGKPAKAEAEYRQALRLRPGYPPTLNGLAFVLRSQGKPAAALRFAAEAVAAELKLGHNPPSWIRYNAACHAAVVGCGQAQDATGLSDAERARLRRQALDWLRTDLAAWGQLLLKQPEHGRARMQQALRHWQQDADFAGVRGAALTELPEAERQAWQQLWKDVELMLKRVNH